MMLWMGPTMRMEFPPACFRSHRDQKGGQTPLIESSNSIATSREAAEVAPAEGRPAQPSHSLSHRVLWEMDSRDLSSKARMKLWTRRWVRQ